MPVPVPPAYWPYTVSPSTAPTVKPAATGTDRWLSALDQAGGTGPKQTGAAATGPLRRGGVEQPVLHTATASKRTAAASLLPDVAASTEDRLHRVGVLPGVRRDRTPHRR